MNTRTFRGRSWRTASNLLFQRSAAVLTLPDRARANPRRYVSASSLGKSGRVFSPHRSGPRVHLCFTCRRNPVMVTGPRGEFSVSSHQISKDDSISPFPLPLDQSSRISPLINPDLCASKFRSTLSTTTPPKRRSSALAEAHRSDPNMSRDNETCCRRFMGVRISTRIVSNSTYQECRRCPINIPRRKEIGRSVVKHFLPSAHCCIIRRQPAWHFRNFPCRTLQRT